MLDASNGRQDLWAEAVNAASYVCNRLITVSFKKNCTPYEALHGREPETGHFRMYGCKAYMHNQGRHRAEKFESRAEEVILIGYSCGNAYRVLIDGCKRVVKTKDVRFEEASEEDNENKKMKMIEIDVGIYVASLDDLISDDGERLNDENQDVNYKADDKGDRIDHKEKVSTEVEISLEIAVEDHPNIITLNTAGSPTESMVGCGLGIHSDAFTHYPSKKRVTSRNNAGVPPNWYRPKQFYLSGKTSIMLSVYYSLTRRHFRAAN